MIKGRRKFILGLFLMNVFMFAEFSLAQEQQEAVSANEPVVAEAANKTVAQPQDLTPEWLWGEVVSVNQNLNQLVVKHVDYESYEEVQTTLTTEEKTMFENVSDLAHILPGDHVTVDYKTKDGISVAELIVVEKPLLTSDEGDKVVESPAGVTSVAEVPEEEVPLSAQK